MNHVTLIGRLGSDPELRQGNSGKAVAKFRIATDHFGNTDWHTVLCFDKTAENVGKFCQKGALVAVTGRVSYRKWDKDDGTSQWFTDIIADRVEFLVTNKSSAQPEPAVEVVADGEEIPF